MALNNYANLKASVLNWSKRSDASTYIDDFIALAESQMIANAIEPLSVRDMEARATATLDSRFLELPSNFISMRRFKLVLSGSEPDVRFMAPEQMRVLTDAGQPRFFTITDKIELDRAPDSAYTVEMQYLRQLDPITSTNTTNAILTNYPQIYLHGCLWALYDWSLQDDKADRHYAKFISAIKGANKQSSEGRWGPAPFMRIEGATP